MPTGTDSTRTWTPSPGEFYCQVAVLIQQLENLALTKAPAPIKPQVTRSFKKREHLALLVGATKSAFPEDLTCE